MSGKVREVTLCGGVLDESRVRLKFSKGQGTRHRELMGLWLKSLHWRSKEPASVERAGLELGQEDGYIDGGVLR